MLRALRSWLHGRAPADSVQIEMPLSDGLLGPDALLSCLRALGLKRIEQCILTRNRRILVSWRGTDLRVHEGFLDAPADVHRAIVSFVQSRNRADRLRAQRMIAAYPITVTAGPPRARPRMLDEDEDVSRQLEAWHRRFNAERFGGSLRPIRVRISRRMRSRLGHYAPGAGDDPLAEIGISERHLRLHGLQEALDTLVHEMVHQWQHESGLPIDHGITFRQKARAIGITPAARRRVGRRDPQITRSA